MTVSPNQIIIIIIIIKTIKCKQLGYRMHGGMVTTEDEESIERYVHLYRPFMRTSGVFGTMSLEERIEGYRFELVELFSIPRGLPAVPVESFFSLEGNGRFCRPKP